MKIPDHCKRKHKHILKQSSGSKAHSNTESIPGIKDTEEVFDFGAMTRSFWVQRIIERERYVKENLAMSHTKFYRYQEDDVTK